MVTTSRGALVRQLLGMLRCDEKVLWHEFLAHAARCGREYLIDKLARAVDKEVVYDLADHDVITTFGAVDDVYLPKEPLRAPFMPNTRVSTRTVLGPAAKKAPCCRV